MDFRKDINGLRGIAVIAVVLFHFNASWLPGGFAGVDVFFVISGFLMTGIIFRGIEEEKFSVLKFYIARANRIVPALAFLCLILIFLGFLYLNPIDYEVLGKHIGGSIGFISNFMYWKEDGYFDVLSHEKWLLHTWSLSVEWQFYIIYPLFLVNLRKFCSIDSMKLTIVYGTILGFVFSVIATYEWPSSSYYLLSTRAWEMMVGGLCFLYPLNLSAFKEKNKKIIEWVGISLIIIAYLFMNKEVAWPGYLSILPVLGACLIIQAQRNNSLITCNIFFEKLGEWSYSIYLWHWPIVVAIYFYSLNTLYIYGGMALSIFLGFLSNKYIEKINFKNNFNSLLSYFNCKPLYMILSVGVIGSAIFLSNGFYFKASEEEALLNKSARIAMNDWSYPAPNLHVEGRDIRFINGSSNKNILFIGASHLEQTFPYVAGISSKYNIYYLTQGGCFLVPSYKPNLDCSNIKGYKDLLNRVDFDKIVTSFFLFDGYFSEDVEEKNIQFKLRVSEFNEFLSFAEMKSQKIFLILGEPKGDEFNPILSVRHRLKEYISIDKARKPYEDHYKALQSITKSNKLIIIDPIQFLCDEVCKVRDENFKYYYKDSEHMRPWYAQSVLSYLDPIFVDY